MATNYGAPPIVTDGLIWRVDAQNTKSNNGGGDVSSIIGNTSTAGFNGTKIGGLSLTENLPKHYNFDGVDDYVLFASNGAILSSNPISLYGKTTATFELWVAPDYTGDSYQRILAKASAPGGGVGGWAILLDPSTSTWNMYVDNGSGGAAVAVNYTHALSAGDWVHIVFTKDGNTWKVYENAVLKNTNTYANTFVATAAGFVMGTWISLAAREYNGKLAVASLYDTELNQTQIEQNYNALKGRFA